jgi:MYXO-CTERM domain-containing protein
VAAKRFLVLIASVALAGLAGAPSAEAQSAGTTWYVHAFSDTYGAGAFLDLLPPTDDDADNTATGDPAPAPLTIRIATQDPLTSAYAAVGTEAQAKVWMKGFQGAPAPQTKVTLSLLSNGDLLGEQTVTHDIVCAGDPTVAACSIVEYDFTIPITATTLAAGATLEMLVVAETADCGCYTSAFYARGSSPDHPWQFTLPFVAGAGTADGDDNSTTNSTSQSSSSTGTTTGPSSNTTTATKTSSSSSTTSSSSSSSDSATTNATADGSKDSPAPPLAFAGLALLLAAVAVRRRLR